MRIVRSLLISVVVAVSSRVFSADESPLSAVDLDSSTRISINQVDSRLTFSVASKDLQSAIVLAAQPIPGGRISVSPKVDTLPGARAVLVSFDLRASADTSQSVSVLLVRSREGSGWTLGGEWSVERHNDGDAGSKSETQRWTIESGTIKRDVHRL